MARNLMSMPALIRSTLGALVILMPLQAVAQPDRARAASSTLPRVAFDERLEQPPVLEPALRRAGVRPGDLPLLIRILVRESALGTSRANLDFRALDERIRLYNELNVGVLLALEDLPASDSVVDAWRQLVRRLAERYAGRVFGYQIGLVVSGEDPDSARGFAYQLKLASVQIRSVDAQARVLHAAVPGADADWHRALYREDIAPYSDGVVVSTAAAGIAARPDVARVFRGIRSLVTDADPDAMMILAGLRLDDPGAEWLPTQFSLAGEQPIVPGFNGSSSSVAAALTTATSLKDLLAGQVVIVDERSVSLKLIRDGRDVTATLPHRLLYNVANLSTYLICWDLGDEGGRLDVELIDQIGRAPTLRDARSGRADRIETFTWDPVTKVLRVRVPVSNRPLLVDFNYGGGDVYVEHVDVEKTPALTVGEIIARHQQAQAAQDALYLNFVASARMEQHFRPSATDTIDIASDTRYYFDREGVEWEEISFSVNGAKWGSDRPAFPLLQAEKVLSLPLDLRLDADYRYTLDGTERVGDRLCYVVDFDPLDNVRSLYRGRIWIDVERFVRLKVRTVQTRLTPPVVSSEEIQFFEPVAEVQNQPLYLFSRLDSKQIFLIAGRNLLVEKQVRFADFRVNAPDFLELRGAARAGDRIMFRETDEGLRHFVKRGGQRVISDELTTSAKALAMGTTVDPSFDFPLPMLGINYLDFDFLGKDTQFAMLFAGVLVLGNVQKPKVGRTPFDASLDFSAFAVPVNDQVFDQVGERRDERVRSIPFSTGVNLGYQFSDFQKVSANYTFRYDAYMRDSETAQGFRLPTRTTTNGLGLSYEYKRAGYSFAASGGAFRRGQWDAWGTDGATFDPADAGYRRYQMSLSKDFYLGAFQKMHFNGAWFGGERLDRFSMYQFGLFDETRMHGVPGAGVRFAELAMLRSSYSFNIFEQYRFDAFLDQAFGKDPADRSIWRPVTGTGLAINLRAPWSTMLRADVGKSFLPQIYSGSGSVIVQVMILKPL